MLPGYNLVLLTGITSEVHSSGEIFNFSGPVNIKGETHNLNASVILSLLILNCCAFK